MARNEIVIEAEPRAVFDVLADGRSYGHWVVGSSEIRDVEPGWPAPGSRFHHKIGVGPFKLSDHTCVEECQEPRLLKLRARARPLGTVFVTMELQAHERGTRVVMIEDPADPLTALVFTPLTHLLVRWRNLESLRRLRRLAEGRGLAMAQAATP